MKEEENKDRKINTEIDEYKRETENEVVVVVV